MLEVSRGHGDISIKKRKSEIAIDLSHILICSQSGTILSSELPEESVIFVLVPVAQDVVESVVLCKSSMSTYLFVEERFKDSVIGDFFGRDRIEVRMPLLIKSIEVVLLDLDIS